MQNRIALGLSNSFFRGYLWGDYFNKTLLLIAGVMISTQFIMFKNLYPYAGFIDGDSYNYISSAFYNLDIGILPIGYSKFLRIFSIFTKSDTAVVAFQYAAVQVAALWFAFTLFYNYCPGRIVRCVTLGLIVLNPVFLYLSNYILSDALFLALSLVWFTSLIWIIRRPSTYHMIVQVLALPLAFMVRYNALYYPIITILALLLSKQSIRRKIICIGASCFVVVLFILFTCNQFRKLTGIWEFSPFSGWQIANNALYAYRFVDSTDRKTCPNRLKALDDTVSHFFDKWGEKRKIMDERIIYSSGYMWSAHSPLNRYMVDNFKRDNTVTGGLKRWASIAPLYSDYGYFIIGQFPVIYFKHYLWPNAIKYFSPPGEFLYEYDMGCDTVAAWGQLWFDYKTNAVKTAFKSFNLPVLRYLSMLAGIMNVLFLLGVLFAMVFRKFRDQGGRLEIVYIGALLWVINFVFSIAASPITLRYQLFGILVFTSFGFILAEYIFRDAFAKAE